MAFQKNQILTLSIESLSNDGSGVAHHDGQAVFVAAAAPGDVAEVRIVKPMKGYAFGKLEKLLTPGPGRNTRVYLTESGAQLARDTAGRLMGLENRIYASWTPEEQALFLRLNRDFAEKLTALVREEL